MQSNSADSFTSLSKRSTLSRGAFSPATVAERCTLETLPAWPQRTRSDYARVGATGARDEFPQPDRQHRYQYASRPFFFHVMSAQAEMERELIVERTRAGLAVAREQGRVGGRRRVMTEEVVERCRRMLENGATRQQIADVIGVGVKTIYKYFPAG